MIDSKPDGSEAEAPKGRGPWMQRGVLAGVCALVIGVYAYTAHPGIPVSGRTRAADHYYNVLVQGFRVGQLNLKTDVPSGFASLADPYDPVAYSRYAVLDLTYYKARFYLYYGVTPAVALFWPYAVLTGHNLLQQDAVVIFCVVGFLASVGLLCAAWRRYFAGVSVVAVAGGALALGLVTLTPFLLAQAEVCEVAISCGYALTMLALAVIWKALHQPERRCWWLAAASLAYGLAVGARPSLLFGAVVLVVPVVQTWRERRPVLAPLLAATGPIVLVGLGLMIYNFLRFDSPFEFGWRYQLSGVRQDTAQRFHLRYLWFNFRVYFLEPVGWGGQFPFVRDITLPPVPAGMIGIAKPFGVLANLPLVWLALAVPLAWRGRSAESCSILRGFVTAVAGLFGICALTLLLFCAAENRYEVEFLPALVLLAVMGILSVERAAAPTPGSGLAERPIRRCAARWGWSLLLAFSVAFNLLVSVEQSAGPHNKLGLALWKAGDLPDAVAQLEQALRLKPDFAEAHNNLGSVLMEQGRLGEAVGQYEEALRLKPEHAEAHNDLGSALVQLGRLPEAIEHYEQAVRLKPDLAEAHNNLGNALDQSHRPREAIGQYEQALRIDPNLAEAHYNWAVALVELGRLPEAIGHYEQALRSQPDYAKAHNNLGAILMAEGRLTEAIGHYEQALRSQPDYAEAHNNLALALAQEGRLPEAIEHWQDALRIKPDYAGAHYRLGLALEQTGRVQEAIQHYEQALRIQPDFVQARNALARARAVP
jgi:tetratricopeptide (TPR) repeat protein